MTTFTTVKDGIGIITTTLSTSNNSADVEIRVSINGERSLCAWKLDDKNEAVMFIRSVKVGGRMVDGLKLSNYSEIKAAFTAEHDAKLAELTASRESHINAIKSGDIALDISWFDGSVLSGYMANGYSADVLVELGLAHDVEDWGCLVDSGFIAALGEIITYQQAVDFAKPALDAIASAESETAAIRSSIFALASETGERQLLDRYTRPCNDPREDCSVDVISKYALPNGKIITERTHSF